MRYLVFLLVLPTILFSQNPNYRVSAIDESLLKNANAVVRLDQINITVEKRDYMVISSKRVVTVFNKEGEKFIHAQAPYDKNDRILQLEARVFDKMGNEIKKFKERDFLDQSAVSGGNLYSDSRIKLLRYTPTSYPYTVEFKREIGSINTAFLPNWYFLDGYKVSVEKSIYTLKVLPDIKLRYKTQHFEEFDVKESVVGQAYTFTARDIPVIKPENLSPSFSEIAPFVKCALEKFHLEGVDGEAKNWKEFGKWMHDELLANRDILGEGTKNKIKAMVAHLTTKEEKVRAVYDFVQDNTRYISVQLGIGGWMPITAEEVDRVKYGDCKGLTNYTKALLSTVDVESFYTVVYAGSKSRNIDSEFPAMQGNHVILNVPLEDKDLWLECTSQQVPVNFLGTFTDNRNVLRITPTGGEIIETTKYLAEDSSLHTKATCDLGANGAIKADVKLVSEGIQYNSRYSLPLRKEEELEEYYKEYWDYVNDLKIKGIELKNEKRDIAFIEEITVEASNYASISDEDLLFAPNMFNRNAYVPKRYRNRKQDLLISRGYFDKDEFTINLPQGFKINTLFEDVAVENKFGHYKVSIEEITPQQLVYKRELLIRSGKYDKSEYASYRDFRRKIARQDNTRIVLTKIKP